MHTHSTKVVLKLWLSTSHLKDFVHKQCEGLKTTNLTKKGNKNAFVFIVLHNKATCLLF